MTNDDMIPQEMIDFAIMMFDRAGQKSRKGHAEANKNPKTDYGLEQLKKGNIYSSFEILFSMVAVTMGGINAVNKKIELLANKEDVSAIKKELTEKVNQTLTPLQEIIKEQKEREARSADIYE
jgi:hypothetical protein